jgi:hypothetical protein
MRAVVSHSALRSRTRFGHPCESSVQRVPAMPIQVWGVLGHRHDGNARDSLAIEQRAASCGPSRAHAPHEEGAVTSLVEPARAADLTPKRQRLLELGLDLRRRVGAPARPSHHAQNAVDAKPRVPEALVGVSLFVHFVSGPHGTTYRQTSRHRENPHPKGLQFRK